MSKRSKGTEVADATAIFLRSREAYREMLVKWEEEAARIVNPFERALWWTSGAQRRRRRRYVRPMMEAYDHMVRMYQKHGVELPIVYRPRIVFR